MVLILLVNSALMKSGLAKVGDGWDSRRDSRRTMAACAMTTRVVLQSSSSLAKTLGACENCRRSLAVLERRLAKARIPVAISIIMSFRSADLRSESFIDMQLGGTGQGGERGQR